MKTHPLVRRLEKEYKDHPTVYGSDRRRKQLLKEALDEIRMLRGTLNGIAGIPSVLWNENTLAESVKAAEKALGDYD